LPANARFYVAAVNPGQKDRTVKVLVNGNVAVPLIELTAGNDGLVESFRSGPGMPAVNGKSTIIIEVLDDKGKPLMLAYRPPVVIGASEFVDIGAQEDMPGAKDFNDVGVCVYWTTK
jgi:hypothetical protein